MITLYNRKYCKLCNRVVATMQLNKKNYFVLHQDKKTLDPCKNSAKETKK